MKKIATALVMLMALTAPALADKQPVQNHNDQKPFLIQTNCDQIQIQNKKLMQQVEMMKLKLAQQEAQLEAQGDFADLPEAAHYDKPKKSF